MLKRPLLLSMLGLLLVLLFVPSVMAQFIPHGDGQAEGEVVPLRPLDQNEKSGMEIMVRVYRTESKAIERVPLEEYVRGVVAAEMPHHFELEALKAQAMAARTYIIRRLVEGDVADTPEGADVRDDVGHQVYRSEEELRRQWGKAYRHQISRINQAVNETVGQVITYKGRPIDATFFSTSNGYTESAAEYWGQEIPYLQSVESPWDTASPRFREEIRLSLDEFQKRLGVNLSLPASSGQPFAEIIARSKGNRVKEVKVGEKTFTGREIRELLDLPSADFNWNLEGQEVVITTTGYGHGVGMSQYGANGMAAQGYSAEEIIKHYYQGVEIEDYRRWIVKK